MLLQPEPEEGSTPVDSGEIELRREWPSMNAMSTERPLPPETDGIRHPKWRQGASAPSGDGGLDEAEGSAPWVERGHSAPSVLVVAETSGRAFELCALLVRSGLSAPEPATGAHVAL